MTKRTGWVGATLAVLFLWVLVARWAMSLLRGPLTRNELTIARNLVW